MIVWIKNWNSGKKIAISACEQCGRNIVPVVRPVMSLEQWLAEPTDELKLTLHPRAKYSVGTLPEPTQGVRLVIGPEGGLSDDEIALTEQYQFQEMLLGPRVLRTETAALTAITAPQAAEAISFRDKMSIKLGIVMDPISSINIKKDTSFAMLEEAQRRGYELYYMEMSDLASGTGHLLCDDALSDSTPRSG